jgi:predicted nucleotidyltransferase
METLISQTYKHHCDLIVESCLKRMRAPLNIVMYGSYGRDEGGWWRSPDGLWCPYNDYDILIISDEKITVSKLREIEDDLLSRIPIRWVDISVATTAQLSGRKSSIATYDLATASTAIYGGGDYLEIIPRFSAASIPLREALTLYLTRLYALLTAQNIIMRNQKMSREGAMFFKNQLAKVVLAVVDGVLLLDSKYHFSYVERQKRFALLPSSSKMDVDLSEWALAQKLRPSKTDSCVKNEIVLLKEVKAFFNTRMFHIMGNLYQKPILGARDLEKSLRYNYREIARKGKAFLKGELEVFVSRLNNNITMSYLGEADPYNSKCLSTARAIEILESQKKEETKPDSWLNASNCALERRDCLK